MDNTKLKILIGSSILFLGLVFTSAFTGSYKLMALGFTQYIIMLIYIIVKTSFKNVTVVSLFNTAEEVSKESFKNKKYAISALYFVSIPLVIIGIIMIVINVIAMWFVL